MLVTSMLVPSNIAFKLETCQLENLKNKLGQQSTSNRNYEKKLHSQIEKQGVALWSWVGHI